ncbi:MAG: flagellar basal body P-ring protein FlgI [Planctomycetota bacterium]
MTTTRRTISRIGAACAVLLIAALARGTDVRDVTRFRGQGDSVIHGWGIVTGLNGTGDSGQEALVARPLAQALTGLGQPVGDLAELAAANAVAIVYVTATIPSTGAIENDNLDVRISTINSAQSLEGGELMMTPLVSPDTLAQARYAIAQGPIRIPNRDNPRVGVVSGGARITRTIDTTPDIVDVFDLVVDRSYTGFSAVSHIAQQINDAYFLTTDPTTDKIARALDERTIRIYVPEVEREDPASFVDSVLSTTIVASQLGVPATIRAYRATGAIVVTGDVRIEPTVITHNDLVITTTLPPPLPTPEAPIVNRENWTSLETGATETELTRIQELLAAFERLDLPARDQIEILEMLDESGKIHGKLIVEGVGR